MKALWAVLAGIAAVTTMASAADVITGQLGFQVTATNGSWTFVEVGRVAQGADVALLVIHVDVGKVIQAIDSFLGVVAKADETMTGSMRVAADEMIGFLTATNEAFDIEGGREAKDAAGLVAILGGIFNLWHGKTVERRLEHHEEAIRATVREIDGVEKMAEGNQRNIDRLNRIMREEMNILKGVDFVRECENAWVKLRSKAQATIAVVSNGLQHKLGVEILGLVNLAKEWKEFQLQLKGHGWMPAIENFLQLFQLHTDVHKSDRGLTLTVTIPVVKEGTSHMRMMEIERRPLWLKDRLMDIQISDEIFVIDNRTGSLMTMTRARRKESCINLGRSWYCLTPEARNTKEEGSCVKAIYLDDWAQVRRKCELVQRPVTSRIWTMGKNEFLVATPKTLAIVVHCDGSEEVVRIERGMYRLRLPQGCWAASGAFRTVASGGRHVETKTVEMDGIDIEGLMPTNGTKEESMERVESVYSAASEVEQLLSHSDSTLSWVAVALAIAAVVGLTAALGALFIRARYGGLKAVLKGGGGAAI